MSFAYNHKIISHCFREWNLSTLHIGPSLVWHFFVFSASYSLYLFTTQYPLFQLGGSLSPELALISHMLLRHWKPLLSSPNTITPGELLCLLRVSFPLWNLDVTLLEHYLVLQWFIQAFVLSVKGKACVSLIFCVPVTHSVVHAITYEVLSKCLIKWMS